ncbi:serine hydrolase [Microcoleus sp. FACHB-1515]|uniref:serine hydrolase n=1 Tax=Cyanophyceae TaxID=3028117 RepID=UPI001687B185|nr:serine hydrolase [Microcoleus sp. FACHB-1515]MBD2092872.1 serine hydrolase [Microcoleus sp. FACHB-1515]
MLLHRLHRRPVHKRRTRLQKRRNYWPLLLVPASLGMLVAVFFPTKRAFAPPIETPYTSLPQVPPIQSLDDLYQMRDRLQAELRQPGSIPSLTSAGVFSTPTKTLQMLQAIEIRIGVEETAKENWNQAFQASEQAQVLTQQANAAGDESEKTLGDIHAQWQQAVNSLESVTPSSLLADDAKAKQAEYQTYLNHAAYNYDTARSSFLEAIAEKTGLPIDSVHITVCHLEGECRRLNGGVPPASPASLIKVPVAVALMEKIHAENINLDNKILVARGNYTEDASDIWVGAEYPLRRILQRMINQSSNIATNQLIEYVGRDRINEIMSDRGFDITRVNTKLVGESTYPANAGVGPNEISMDELTEMMRQIYQQQHPGDEVLIDAMASQEDLVLGHDGLKPTSAIWLGEKTGQNSKVLGTTLAMKIAGETYVMSISLDYSGNERAIRQCVRDVANHIAKNGL